ncbi:metal ABC transporter permease [Corynebacterium silvaticum]|uniref:metal ABC transporter permease n=1 Tax=Corynebacterium silvaticum TaxID=2320431 RepID=UPI0010684FDB|nr:metal ABC transporter permease [Corynebacterium silvaticum]MBH5300176.1 metal ABC transporter permease [Corynebacterium silvaticum]NOM65592.1 metal ABC transporter permease [Corynebacterium silvaticum]TFA92000.1 metal ABC transporter permease [Corynebacterium silvaticum]TFA92023.1 metal ABC transporter permease [Corynebacterium silvaticum]TNX79243.1 metal ABC transporter permease [Corynebacterium silvaticum]
MLIDVLTLPILELISVGALCGLVGVFTVLKQRVFFTESVTHATFPGAILGVVILGRDGLYLGALIMCILMAVAMRWLTRIHGQSSQASAGIILTVSFALGYFLNKWFAPLPIRIEGFLAGSVLTVRVFDVVVAGVVLVVSVGIVNSFQKHLVYYSFDEMGFRAAGGNVKLAESLILAMIVATVVCVIPAIGTILSIALIAAPTAGLHFLVSSPTKLLWLAPMVGVSIGLVGLGIAVAFNLSAGGTIAVVAGVFYGVCMSLSSLKSPRTT